MNAWRILGIPSTRDPREIRRAYATRLKTINQRTEQEAFQKLRSAYEYALGLAAQAAAADDRQTEQPSPNDGRATEEAQAQTMRRQTTNPEPSTSAEPSLSNSSLTSGEQEDKETDSLATEIHDQRDQDWARAEELVGFLADTLNSKGEDAAIKAFRETLASEELHSLQLRDMLEWRLIFALAQAKQLPLDFVSMLVDVFDWRDRRDLFATSAGPALQELLRRRDVQLKYNELHALATTNYYSAHFSGTALTRQAARSLLSGYSPWRFRWQAMSTAFLKEMRALLDEIYAHAPELPESFLDTKTVEFWRRAVENPPPSFGLLGFGGLIGFFISVIVAADMTGPAALRTMGLVILVTMVALIGFASVRRYWLRTWQPKIRVWLAAGLERSIGRALPGAVQAGLGWKHVMMTLVFAPFLALALTGFLLSMEQSLGRLYVPALMLASFTGLSLFFATYYQVKHLVAHRWPRAAAHPGRWKVAWNTLLVVLAVVAAAAGHPAMLGILMVSLFVNYARSQTRR